MDVNTHTADQLEICGLEVSCIIGELPDERVHEQLLTIDATLSLDLKSAARSDQLNDTIDYAKLCADIRTVLKQARCRMIERVAQCVANVCLRDPQVQKARVRIEKHERVEGLRAAAVVIERSEIINYE